MNTNKKCTVYRIVCDVPEDRVVYIGKTTQPLGERLSHHATIQRKPTRLNKYINEVGKEHFRIEEIDSSYDHEAMAALERVAIVESGCLDLGFNVRIGSRFTEEDKIKNRFDRTDNKPVRCVTTG